MSIVEQGCIDIWIDEIVPCLKDTENGEIKETVMRVRYMDLPQIKNCWRCIIMDGKKPKFLENTSILPSYYERPDPYTSAPSCHVNLLELSRYAKKCGKRLVDLTKEEVQKFSI